VRSDPKHRHRPRYIEPAVVLEFGEGTSSAAEAKQTASIVQSAEEPTVVLKVPTVGLAKAKDDKAKEPHVEKVIKAPEILSPPVETELPKAQKTAVATPKRRRMASMLDTVIETTKALTPASTKKTVEAAKNQVEAEAGPSAPTKSKVVVPEDKVGQQSSDTGKTTEQVMTEKAKSHVPEALAEDTDYIVRHASGKKLSEEEILEAKHYAQRLKYLKGALVFNGSNEDDFMYCLPDNKEISVCQEMAKSMGFPKLEEGLSVVSKDDLADSLVYNSIKVYRLILKLENGVFYCHAQLFLLLCRA
jgi:uncharacterized protein YaaR (DUF327 family)